jgi:cell division protein FtsQ
LSATSTWLPSRATPVSKPGLYIPVRAGRLARWLVSLVGLAVLGAAAWGVTHSRVFELRSLRVTGTVHLTAADVASIGGLSSRTNVLWLSTGALERRLERDPWIRDVRISRTLPADLSIRIIERSPAAIVAPSQVLLSSDGVVLGPADPSSRLPVIEGQPRVGSGVTRLPAGLPALQVIRSLPQSVVPFVARVGFDSAGRLTLVLRSGTPVVFGDAGRAAEKGAALEALLRWVDGTGVRAESIDLTVPTAPAIRTQPGAAA